MNNKMVLIVVSILIFGFSTSDGIKKDYYQNGKLRGKWYFRDKKLHILKKYYENGNLSEVYHFKDGVSQEKLKECFPDGNLSSEWKKEFGGAKNKGLYKLYMETQGVIRHYLPYGPIDEEFGFKYGKREGLHKIYSSKGFLKWETNYKNGIADGIAKEYYRDGKIKWKCTYKNGEKQEATDYYEDGKIKAESVYKNGDLISEKTYDKQGNLINTRQLP